MLLVLSIEDLGGEKNFNRFRRSDGCVDGIMEDGRMAGR